MSDVSAVFLTIGEPYADRALASVGRQSLPAAEVVVVDRSISPFHRAFNAGASRVRTQFFVQVDADLVLDRECFAALRDCMRADLGVVTGRLRDPLLGRIGAVRLFRTRCFERGGFPDTVSPDTDFGEAIEAAGWGRLDALGRREGPRELWHTLGEHLPDYTPLYTFSKFRLGGARCRYRRSPYLLREMIARFHASRHPAARLALLAFAHGIFHRDASDQLQPYAADGELECAVRMCEPAQSTASAAPEPPTGKPAEIFARYLALGGDLVASEDRLRFALLVDGFAAAAAAHPPNTSSLVALLALCHGIFAGTEEADLALLEGWGVLG
jgi:hypothetical protein